MLPSAAANALCADAWLPRPRAGQPSLNRSDTTPIPTEYKASKRPQFGYAQKALTVSLAPASGARETVEYS